MNKKEVIERIGEKNWNKFTEFMRGQTVGLIDGKCDYYKWDVEKFERNYLK